MNSENNPHPQYVQDAIEFEVPFPDTCKALDWQEPTVYCWLNDILCRNLHYHDIVGEWVAYGVETDIMYYAKNKMAFVPAPQVGKIVRRFPEKTFQLRTDENAVSFDNHKVRLSVDIQNYHIVEACALLFKDISEEGFL